MAELTIPIRKRMRVFFDDTSKQCSTCLEIKPLDLFYPRAGYAAEHDHKCKPCRRLYDAMRKRDKPPKRKHFRHKSHGNSPRSREEALARATLYRKEVKEQIITAYGGACNCCGETDYNFLTIDHIDGKGYDHRRRSRNSVSGDGFYRKLRIDGFPKDNYQLLCWNCNCAKGMYGQCPHVLYQQKLLGYVSDFHALFTDPDRLQLRCRPLA